MFFKLHFFAVVMAAFLMVCLLSPSVTALSVRERVIDGHYCGSYSFGVIKGIFNTTAGSKYFDININAMGDNMSCTNESYTYDPETHRGKVDHATDPDDCLGAALTNNKLTLEIEYLPDTDVVKLDFGFTHVDCKKCEDPQWA